MGRLSTKENKNRYQLIREELGLSREKASELLESISPERLEKIENERSDPHPDEVLLCLLELLWFESIIQAGFIKSLSLYKSRRVCKSS